MSKFKRVLSDAELISATFKAEAEGTMAELRAVERAVLAKLTEQEPVAWFTEDHLTDRSATTYDPSVRAMWECIGRPVKPLYAYPLPSNCQGFLDSPNHNQVPKEPYRTTKNHIPDGWQLVPVEPTENQIISAMEASLLGRPSVDDDAYVMSIIEAYLSAAPKYTGDK